MNGFSKVFDIAKPIMPFVITFQMFTFIVLMMIKYVIDFFRID